MIRTNLHAVSRSQEIAPSLKTQYYVLRRYVFCHHYDVRFAAMDASFEFAEVDSILRITLSGEMTDAAVMDLWSKGLEVVASFPSCKSIVNLSGITRFDVSTNTIVRFAKSHSPDLPARVFVAPKDEIYGMTRMFQVLSESTRKNVHVVRTMHEAYTLLGVELPTFVPVNTH